MLPAPNHKDMSAEDCHAPSCHHETFCCLAADSNACRVGREFRMQIQEELCSKPRAKIGTNSLQLPGTDFFACGSTLSNGHVRCILFGWRVKPANFASEGTFLNLAERSRTRSGRTTSSRITWTATWLIEMSSLTQFIDFMLFGRPS